MKKLINIILTISCLILIISCSNNNKTENIDINDQKEIRWISADVGLNMRTNPSTDSEIITLIPYNEEVIVLEVSDEYLTIGNIKGNWIEVKYKDKIGWVFGGYLSKEKLDIKKEQASNKTKKVLDIDDIVRLFEGLKNNILYISDNKINLNRSYIINDKKYYYTDYKEISSIFGKKESIGGDVFGSTRVYDLFSIETEPIADTDKIIIITFILESNINLNNFINKFGYPEKVIHYYECCYDFIGVKYKINNYKVLLKSKSIKNDLFKTTRYLTEKSDIDNYKEYVINYIKIFLDIYTDF